MRKLFCLSMMSLLLVVKIVWAQAPVTIQGVATDSQGLPLSDAERSITFSIYEFQESKIPLWSEQHIVAIKDGLFSATLGNVNPLKMTLDKPYWLGIKIGDDAEMSPRLKLITTGANSVASASGQTASKTTAGPGGSNTGLDAAYDEGSTITTDAGAVNIEGAGGLTVEGSIGVGTTTPATGVAIHLKDGRMRISHGSNAPGFTLFDDADGDFFRLQHQRSGDQFEIRNSFDAVVFMVEKTGEVGIGTATPSAKLDVVGNTELNGDVDINSDLDVDDGTLHVDGTNDRVGVGTTNPLGTFHVNTSVPDLTRIIISETGDTQEDHLAGISFLDGPNFKGGIFKTGTFNDITFWSAGNERMRIQQNGNVGIGTDSPGSKLEVNGTVAASTFAGTSPLIFEAPAGIERMRIDDSNGNVGIGTMSPNAPLDIFNTSGVRIGGSTSKFIVLDTFGTGNDIRTVGGDLFIEFLRSNAVDILNGFLRINTNGNIGIGTTNPTSKLQVEGNVDINSDLDVDGGTLHVDGANDRVGVGTASPDTTFHVVGNIKMVDGNEASGKILTSDSNGLATWEAPSFLGVAVYSDDLTNGVATATSTFTDSELSVTFTPFHEDNPIVIQFHLNGWNTDNGGGLAAIISIGGSTQAASLTGALNGRSNNSNNLNSASGVFHTFLPAVLQTIKIQFRNIDNTGTANAINGMLVITEYRSNG